MRGWPRTRRLILACGLVECALIYAACTDWSASPRLKRRAVCDRAAGAQQPPTVYPGVDMSLALATAYDRAYEELALVSVRSKRAYAARHGLWLYVVGPGGVACDRPASWSKVVAVRAALAGGHEWVLWMDADAVFASLSATLYDASRAHVARAMRQPEARLILSCDGASGRLAINNGIFLLRRSSWADAFLAAVWNATRFLADTAGVRNSRFGDQRAFEHVLERLGGATPNSSCAVQGSSREVVYVPQREINAYPATYAEGDLIVHIAGCLAGARRTRAQCAAALARWAAVDPLHPGAIVAGAQHRLARSA